ncbi:uncharacterized protein LOC6550063 [Drosophila erecta]|uniref:Uncharacterized protein n=1 Tax=Drosophila erecta TaxID=7220 RepID=B3NWB0_DROER|nr:uncharacterized protein LOC6550063 [Drosophila erecta]EDV46449.1 uncharacterized protein Dere_GG18207 [Drosophila erecta]
MYKYVEYSRSRRSCRHCSCSSSATELSPRTDTLSSSRRTTGSNQKGQDYRYAGYADDECCCLDPRCPLSTRSGQESPSFYSERTSRKSQQNRSSSKHSNPSKIRSRSIRYMIPKLPSMGSDEDANPEDHVQCETNQSESSMSSGLQSKSTATLDSRYREDGPEFSAGVKSTGKCSCACFKPEHRPRSNVLMSAEEIRNTVRSQIAALEKSEAIRCDCDTCKSPSGKSSSSERAMNVSRGHELAAVSSESEKLEPDTIDCHVSANDLVRTEIIDPLIRRLQRVYLNNKIHELGILDSLHDVKAQIKEIYRKREK